MDWTGGVRRRFAPGKNKTVIQKQKAHFAKARSALNNTPKANVPFKPALYADAASRRHDEPIHCQDKTPLRRYNTPREIRVSRLPRSRPNGGTHVQNIPRQIDTNDGVVYITSSSIPSSTSLKPGEHAATADELEQTHAGERTGNEISEEQRLLLANRRRLLVRLDWLGLSATKPVHIKFRSCQDKDRIGKRRKVASSASQKGQPATRRLITPLFEERQLNPEHMMSGALYPDEVQVKIGTDAFASQTQRSHHSQTPRLPLGRKASTDLGPLSEEPMLLGDEGDEFEMMNLTTLFHSHHGAEASRHQVPDVDDPTWFRDNSTAYPEYVTQERLQLQRMPEIVQMTRTYSSERCDKQASTPETSLANVSLRGDNERIPAEVECNEMLDSPPLKPSSRRNSSRHNIEPLPKRTSIALPPHDEGDGDEEAFWKRLMQFEEAQASYPSTQAVKSSGLHATASTSSHRPVLRRRSPAVSHIPSTPRGVGTQRRILRENADGSMTEDSADLVSPSTSLHAIQRLANQPAHLSPHCKEKASDDAAWREFIIGSQSSSEAPLRHERDHQPLPMMLSRSEEGSYALSLDVSGLGTFVECIERSTQHARPQNIHSLSQDVRGSTAQRHSHRQHGPVMPQRRLLVIPSNPCAEADEIETDDIKQSVPATTQLSRLVQHAPCRVLNPKQSKSTKRHLEKVSSNIADVDGGKSKDPSRITTQRKDKKVHSVYDLVDSDGVSLA